MIFSENRYALFRIMLERLTRQDEAGEALGIGLVEGELAHAW